MIVSDGNGGGSDGNVGGGGGSDAYFWDARLVKMLIPLLLI